MSQLLSALRNRRGAAGGVASPVPPVPDGEAPPFRHPRLRRLVRWGLVTVAALAVAVTAASFGYNLATDGPAPRPSGLLMAHGGGFDTRYRSWGASGTPIVLVPGAFETADTFAPLGAVLGRSHRVFAIDLTGTGYSAPSPPYSASHLAQQLLAFLSVTGLDGANAPVLVGHSSGAAVVGLAAVAGGPRFARGVVFLDGDATPLSAPGLPGLAADRPVPDFAAAARAQSVVADPANLQLAVRADVPAAESGGRGDVAAPAAAAGVRVRGRLLAEARDP